MSCTKYLFSHVLPSVNLFLGRVIISPQKLYYTPDVLCAFILKNRFTLEQNTVLIYGQYSLQLIQSTVYWSLSRLRDLMGEVHFWSIQTVSYRRHVVSLSPFYCYFHGRCLYVYCSTYLGVSSKKSFCCKQPTFFVDVFHTKRILHSNGFFY